MLKARTHRSIAGLLVGAACLIAPALSRAAIPARLSGSIAGIVSDSGGIPQMGAAVLLLNRQDRVFQKVFTDDRGEFRFLGLLPDTYSIRVSLATFVPAFKREVLVQPGMRSMLRVSLNTLLSTIQISYPTVDNGTLMTDDWKWVLRSASATRPVLRFAPELQPDPLQVPERVAAFSETRGMLRVSAGEGGLNSSTGSEADLGTAFALATSLYGNNMLHVSGNLGYGSTTGVPSAAFRTTYSRSLAGGNPEVSLTMRQLFLPARLGPAVGGNDAALPMLRTMSAAFSDSMRVADIATFQYGFTMDSVTFLDHLNYFSPYARLTLNTGRNSELEFTYTSGNARPDLGGNAENSDLQRDLSSLGLFPRVSLRGARPRVQRGEEYEVAYTKKAGSRRYTLSAYHERVTNAAVSMVAPAGLYAEGDILPDLFSGNSIFNAGNYDSTGYSASVTQDIGEHLSATIVYGSMGALGVEQHELVSNDPDELRAMIHASRTHAATARIAATAPRTGTHLIASYQWTADNQWAMPGNMYSTQSIRPIPGLNIYVRQPLPRMGSLPWRMEATADLRNLLAEGYLPLQMADGQQAILVQTPRSIRGGLSFIF